MFQQAYYKLLPLVSASFSSHAMPYGLRENCAAMVWAVFHISRLLLLLRQFLPHFGIDPYPDPLAGHLL